ncbi:MAG: M1 family metallopeptidase [Bacteroidota bacterium]|nr:M1 family metallopeptidase [Bacteroidota bacterium]
MKKTLLFIFIFAILNSQFTFAQFTHADTLRGTYGPARSWWNVLKYDLHVKFNISDSSINGFNVIYFKVLQSETRMQIDLQEPLIIDSILLTAYIPLHYDRYNQEKIISPKQKITSVTKDGNAYFIDLPVNITIGSTHNLIIYYHGQPHVAKKAPWDGGVIWTKDKNGNPWVTIACQGLGASVWYPCKDHQSDEPDSAELHITAPSELVSVANGTLRNKVDNKNGTSTYSWAVVNPINNYNIIPYIGKYVNFNEVYKGEKGNLEMNYWVLDYNLEKAKNQFTDALRMMKAFEYWFGPYPFYEDGYKLVDAPHLGMEHQSAIAYGNKYVNGYTGRDLSGSGWGLKWDFIIVHESGHEWFGNNITSKDIADMWIHEGITNYSETLFTEYYYGKKAGDEYVIGTRKKIANDKPIIGYYGVNNEGSGDMYYKGGNMLHTIRQIIDDDEKFRRILRGLNKTFYHQTVTTQQVENYISKSSGIDLSKVFDEYLRTTMVPTLEYKIKKGVLSYRWANVVKGFKMPLKVMLSNHSYSFIYPTEVFREMKISSKELKVDENFYVNTNQIK